MADAIEYVVSNNGTAFHAGTCADVRSILDDAIKSYHGARYRVWFGDVETGRAWAEEHETIGYISRTCGVRKVPLLVHNSRSLGGHVLLDHCIVKIARGGRVLYQHPNFSQPVFTADDCAVFQDGETFAPKCKSPEAARRLAAFMNGERNSK
jgi:hypothetical protein